MNLSEPAPSGDAVAGHLISIIVISNNSLEHVLPTVEAARAQDLGWKKQIILVLEEREPEDSWASIGRLLPADVIFVPVSRGQGIPFNRNRGLEASSGDIVVFLDDDCMPSDGWLWKLIEPIVDGGAAAVVGGARVVAATPIGRAIAGMGFPAGGSVGFDRIFPVKADGDTDFLSTCNCALRTDVVTAVGGFDESLSQGGEDTDLGLRIRKAGYNIKYQPSSVVDHSPRERLIGFLKWQFRRGRAKRQILYKHKFGTLVGVRIRSTGTLFRQSVSDRTFVWFVPLMIGGYFVQGLGFFTESFQRNHKSRMPE